MEIAPINQPNSFNKHKTWVRSDDSNNMNSTNLKHVTAVHVTLVRQEHTNNYCNSPKHSPVSTDHEKDTKERKGQNGRRNWEYWRPFLFYDVRISEYDFQNISRTLLSRSYILNSNLFIQVLPEKIEIVTVCPSPPSPSSLSQHVFTSMKEKGQ